MSAAHTIAGALDHARFDAIAEFANLASSYWSSIALAAERGECLVETHCCRQVAAVTREAFATVKAMGCEPDSERQAT